MKSDRLIRIISDIDSESFKAFSEQVRVLELEAPNRAINVELSSCGGTAYDALAFTARMRLSPCKFTVTAFGYVASAAVLILAAGDTRKMTKESWVMVHEDSGETSGTTTDKEREAAHDRRMEDQWSDLLEKYTGTKASHWAFLHRKTTYLSAGECLNLNLIQEVV